MTPNLTNSPADAGTDRVRAGEANPLRTPPPPLQSHIPLPPAVVLPTPPAGIPSFSQDLDNLLTTAAGKTITIAQLESSTQGRGIALIVAILSVPFLLPVSIPVLSVLIGIGICILGVRLSLGMNSWLPAFIRRREIKYTALVKIVGAGKRIARPIERLLRARATFMFWPTTRWLTGISIALAGLALGLPIPPVIPFSNTIPAFAIILLAIGWMERDGIATLIGHAVMLSAWGYLFVWSDLIFDAFKALHKYFS